MQIALYELHFIVLIAISWSHCANALCWFRCAMRIALWLHCSIMPIVQLYWSDVFFHVLANSMFFFLACVFVLVPLADALAGAFGWCFWLVLLVGAFYWCFSLMLLASITSCAFYYACNPSCRFYCGGDGIMGLNCADYHEIASCRLASWTFYCACMHDVATLILLR